MNRTFQGLAISPVLLAAIIAGCTDAPGTLEQSTGALAGASQEMRFSDDFGVFAEYSTTGSVDANNAFFADLGTNGRSCGTCHRLDNGMSITTAKIQELFDSTGGTDPIFRPIDGANTPNADFSTVEARRAAYSLLLNRGVIRIEIPMPNTATRQFDVVGIEDPYGNATPELLSVYRRPIMASNLKFRPAFMWDAREATLEDQAQHAHLRHAQGTGPLPADVLASIVDFEKNLFTAQTNAVSIGTLENLDDHGGGPIFLSQESFTPNLNSPARLPAHPISLDVMNLYPAWAGTNSPGKQAVLRGQELFNFRPMNIAPPTAGLPNPNFTCADCHAVANVGTNDKSGGNFADLGLGGGGFVSNKVFLANMHPDPPATDLPIYTLKRRSDGMLLRINDPGKALISGIWPDVGRSHVSGLRGVASHAPYFRDGSAKNLGEVIDFYDRCCAIPAGVPFSAQEKSDLVAFLSSL